MEERNLELDDDGKIRLRIAGEEEEGEELSPDDIVIDIPDYRGFSEEEEPAAAQERQRDRRREDAGDMLAEADALFAQGDLVGAGEKYLDSSALYGADWRPWFGIVRVQTKDLTDFADFDECRQAYDKAVRRMRPADKAELAARYGASLERMAEECADRAEKLSAADEEKRAAARPGILREYGAALRRFAVFGVLLVLFAVAAGVLFPLIDAVPGYQILIAAIVCAVCALVCLVVTAAYTRRFVRALAAKRRNGRAGSTEEGRQARIAAETEEYIRMILEDLL